MRVGRKVDHGVGVRKEGELRRKRCGRVEVLVAAEVAVIMEVAMVVLRRWRLQ